jgi:hypothetical protein
LEEEGTAALMQKTDSFTKFKTSDDTTKFYVVKKEATLEDSPGLSQATRTPQRSAKMATTYKDASEESDIESDEMKPTAVKKQAALKGGPANRKDEEGDSEIESVAVRKVVRLQRAAGRAHR